MKKLTIILFFSFFALVVNAQSIFKPIPANLFSQDKYALNQSGTPSAWLWRFSAQVTAEELIWDKTAKKFNSAPLSSVGPAIGYHHFVALADGTPYNDWGVNFAALLGTDINTIVPASIKIALTLNCFQFVNIGIDYGFQAKTVGILLGASVNF
jgi:hypothetical protein